MHPTRGSNIRVTITDISTYGEGIGKSNGFTIFAKNGLPGEDVDVRLSIIAKQYAVGTVTKWHTPSSLRLKPPCPHFNLCGGCQLLHYKMEGQLLWKQKWVRDCLERIAKIKDPPVRPVLASPNSFHYRDKIQVPVQGRPGHLSLGYFQPRTHRLIDLQKCYIQPEIFTEILHALKRIFHELKFGAYDERRHQGMLRHIVLRAMPRDKGQKGPLRIVLGLVVHQGKDKLGKFIPYLKMLNTWLKDQKDPAEIVGCFVNYNHRETNFVYGQQTETLWGDPHLRFGFHGVRFDLSPTSFLQVNPDQMFALTDQTIKLIGDGHKEVLLDCYCGIGTFAFALRERFQTVIGIEENPQAIKDAINIAKDNGLEHLRFFSGTVEDKLKEYPKADVVVLDPPRHGCAPEVIAQLLRGNYERLIYISCHPATQARDISLLKEKYDLEYVQPVDMFPQTTHVECLTLLRRR
jgi:23S rRNA (uracil1939-C5)-methyltransferase